MALSTSEGKRWGVRELALHCGVSKSWVQDILGGVSGSGQCQSISHTPTPHKKAVAVLWARVEAALRADPGRPDTEIAKEIGCDDDVVRKRRRALDLPKSDASRRKSAPTRDKAAELLRASPERSNRRIAKESGSTPETVAKLRERLVAVAPVPVPPQESAEVIELRPRIEFAQWRKEALRVLEAATSDDRTGFLLECYQRWPEALEPRSSSADKKPRPAGKRS
jgi:hypothetical protein